jgi:hypothetical protein
MLIIVCHHFLWHGFGVVGFDNHGDIEYSILNAFVFIGVNCFVLITGYFGIKFKIKSIVSLWVKCFCYSLLFYVIYRISTDQNILNKSILGTVFCVKAWWFIEAYIILYLMSPILNLAIERLDKSNFIKILILLTVTNIYFGFFNQNAVNPSGYNAVHFAYLYFIGRYLNIYGFPVKSQSKTKLRFGLIGVYAICSVILGSLAFLSANYTLPFALLNRVWYYNNPFVILSAIAFFWLFTTFDIKSKFINWTASSVLAVYLVQENKYFREDIYQLINKLDVVKNPVVFIAILVSITLIFFIGCILFDKIFRLLVVEWVEKVVNKMVVLIKSIINRKIARKN